MRGFYLLAPRAAKAQIFWCYSLFHDSPEFSNVVTGSHYRKKVVFFRLNGLQNRFEALKAEFHREPKSGQVCGTGCPACPSTDRAWLRKRQTGQSVLRFSSKGLPVHVRKDRLDSLSYVPRPKDSPCTFGKTGWTVCPTFLVQRTPRARSERQTGQSVLRSSSKGLPVHVRKDRLDSLSYVPRPKDSPCTFGKTDWTVCPTFLAQRNPRARSERQAGQSVLRSAYFEQQ